MEEKDAIFDLNSLLINVDDGLEEGEDFNPFAENAEIEEENFENEELFENKQSKRKKTNVADENEDSLEDVGNDEEEKESTEFPEKNGTSPNNLYSSIAKLLKEEGTFPDLEDFESINDVDSFVEAIQNQIKNSIDEEYQRIDAALNAGVKPDELSNLRNTVKWLNDLTEDDIKKEENEELRKNIILQEMVNRGYSKDKAERVYQKSLERGDDDVEDALEALEAVKEFYSNQYQKLLDDAKKQEEAVVAQRKKSIENFKKSIMEDKDLYGKFEVDKKARQTILDSLTKPVYTDKKTGNTYTAVQKWQIDNPDSYAKTLGLMYYMTNGGKDFENLIKGEVKKKVSKARSEFENALRNTSARMEGGKMRLVNAHDTDNESYLKDYTLDL